MSTTAGPFRFLWIPFLTVLLIAAVMSSALAQGPMEVVEADGSVEWARVIPDLERLESESRLTVRALRGFGRLPESFARLALDLRRHGVDLLAAGPEEIRDLLARAESGELNTDPGPLRDLLALFENRDYYEWVALQPGDVFEPGENDLIRGQGLVVLRDEAGLVSSFEQTGSVESLTAMVYGHSLEDMAASDALRPSTQDAPGLEVNGDQSLAADAPVPDLPRIWSGAPGMRLLGLNIPLQWSDMEWTKLAAICPAPDGGYVVAGSMDTPAGLQAWAVRYDAQGMPVWSRVFGGDFNAYLTGVVALGDQGFLLGGSLETDRPGFLIALDNSGNVLWSRAASKAQGEAATKDWFYGLAAEGQKAVAVGQVKDQNDVGQALIMAVPADGSGGWRTEIKDGQIALQAVADGDGWVVGGQAAQPAGDAWVAKVDGQGQVVWSRTYEGHAAVDALARTPDGELLTVGVDHDGKTWLRTLDSNGEVSREVALDLALDGIQVPHSVLGMSLGADGDIWLAGQAVSEDGWLARTDGSGQVRWVRVYGQDDADALKSVLVTSGGATAVGRSFSPNGMGCYLWLLNVNDAGQPLEAVALSEEAQIFAKALEANDTASDLFDGQGAVHLVQNKDGSVEMALPFALATQGLPGFGGHLTDAGLLRCQARPVAGNPGRWDMTVALPALMPMYGDNGNEIGALISDDPQLSFVFDANLTTALAFNLAVKNLRVETAKTVKLEGLYKDLNLETQDVPMASSSFSSLQANMKLDQGAGGLWSGPLTLEARDWKQVSAEGKATGHLGSVRVAATYENLDLAALGNLPARIEELLMSETEPDQAAFSQLVESYVRGIGTGQGELVLQDFFLADEASEDGVSISEIRATGAMASPEPQSLLRDMSGAYLIKGLDFKADSAQVALKEVSAEMRLDRLALATIMNTAFGSMFDLGQDSGWQEMVTKMLGGLELKLGVQGLGVTMPGQEPVRVDRSALRFSLTDLDAPNMGLALAYDHEGVSGLPAVPPEVMPGAARFDASLTQVPLVPLLTALPMLAADPTAAFTILAEHGSKLNINAVAVDVPLGGLRLSGLGQAEASGPAPMGRLNADIEVRNFQALTNWLAGTLDENERQGMLAVATMVQLAGTEEQAGDGNVLHRYKVEFDSQGKLNVNGKDLSALLGGGQPPSADSPMGAQDPGGPAEQGVEEAVEAPAPVQ